MRKVDAPVNTIMAVEVAFVNMLGGLGLKPEEVDEVRFVKHNGMFDMYINAVITLEEPLQKFSFEVKLN